MRELKKKQYWGSLSLLLFVVIVAMGYFMVYPSVSNIKEINTQIAAIEIDVTDLQSKITTLKKLNTDMTNSPDKIKLLELGIPRDDAQAEVIASLSSIATNSGITIKSISQIQTTEADFTQILLSFETSYNGFILMLGALENNIRFGEIKNINLAKNVQTLGSEGFISGSITINMYKYTGKNTIPQTEEGSNE